MNFEKLQNLMDNAGDVYGVLNCDCSVYYRHKEVFRCRRGFTDLARKRPASEDDLYFLYSASKPALAVAVMQLVEKGLLSLTDPVSRYIPEYGKAGVKVGDKVVPCDREATIEDLLAMQGGLNYSPIMPGGRPDLEELIKKEPGISTRDFIREVLSAPLDFQPGTRFLYSMCLDVLAVVVEIVTGQKYSEYLKEHIADPLGMKDFYMHVPEDGKDRMVQQYQYDVFSQNSIDLLENVPIDPCSNITIFGPNYDCGGGGVISRVTDYVLFADALANDGVGANGSRILSKESIDNMRTNRLDTPLKWADFTKMQNYGYGYGLGVRTLVNPKAAASPVGEFGWDGLGGAFFLSDVENRIAIFYLMSQTAMIQIKPTMHNKIRDFTYEALQEEIGK